ncbi:MAG: four helix bundle protein, partial [Chloroflexota bacterium]
QHFSYEVSEQEIRICQVYLWTRMVCMRDFRKIKAWEKAHQLVLEIYRVTQVFPVQERYGLTSQMRRASSSIPANIAEGCGKNSETELARYMQNSMGSASELEYHLLLAKDLGYQQLNASTIEVKKMLAPFINRLRKKS